MKQYNLTEGNILRQITRLSLPIMGSGFIQMSYQLMDMFWLGRGSSEWVAAAATAGYAMWVANALCLIVRLGAEIGVGQALGSGHEDKKREWIDSALMLAVGLSILYGVAIYLLSPSIVRFFGLESASINQNGVLYLRIVALGMPVTFFNPLMVGYLNAAGDSKTSFQVNAVGIIANMILDPLMIFGLGWGVAGAAIATVIAQVLISCLYLTIVIRKHSLFRQMTWFRNIKYQAARRILFWGTPSGLQSIFFALVSALISRFVAEYGSGAFAAYRVGVEVESIGWLTMMGLSSALTAFSAQNFGANRPDRVWSGFIQGTVVGVVVGTVAMLVLILGAQPLSGLFLIDDPEALASGAVYLVVAGVIQIPMSLDYTASGVFQGMGNTLYPSIGGIFGNAIRIPLALWLRSVFGLYGIFYAIAISAVLKGLLLYPWFIHWYRNKSHEFIA